MGQVNVNTPPPADGSGGAAAAGMGMGMLMMVIIGVIVLLLIAFFVLRPMLFGGPANVNVNVRSSDVTGALNALGFVA
jgi:hypothetical protein